MKYLKTKNISKHSISDRTFITYYPSGTIVTNTNSSLKLPTGDLDYRTVSPEPGMVRFTTNLTSEYEDIRTQEYFPTRSIGLEVYFDGQWVPVRLQGSATIKKYDLGSGNWDAALQPNEDLSKYFPISGDPLPIVPDGADNIIVLVENVFQISETNFDLIQSDGDVVAVEITNPGSGYTSASVTFGPPDQVGGTQAEGSVVLSGGEVESILITVQGSGYTSPPSVSITGDGIDAAGTSRITKPGWHLKFLSAVPFDKAVTVYYGFDQ